MSNIVIRAEKLGKQYAISSTEKPHNTLRDAISGFVTSFSQKKKKDTDESSFWALKEVSFEVRRGEVVGIMGRNGAGKTTLLKILSRITQPTEGVAEIHGRVGSLLEVGTGFHPELSGRENIYLNAAIMGMNRQEIDKKFEEIASFAEVGRFIDTPVKHYSSGMYVRLAFAVAAHLEPEILFIDEVLAVGDAAFQKKCMGKMSDVASEGRTILFVSHNLTAVQSLCTQGCLLDAGRLVFFGGVGDAIQMYLNQQSAVSEIDISKRTDRFGNGSVRITSISIETVGDSGSDTIRSGDSLKVRICYENCGSVTNARFLVGIYDLMNVPLFRLDSQTTAGFSGQIGSKGVAVCDTGSLNVSPGPCYLNVAIFTGTELADHVIQALSLSVEASDFYSSGRMFERRESLFLLPQRWYLDETAN